MGSEVEGVQRGVAVVVVMMMGKGRVRRGVVRAVTVNVAIVVVAGNELRTPCATGVCKLWMKK